jgi:hypothetical protein
VHHLSFLTLDGLNSVQTKEGKFCPEASNNAPGRMICHHVMDDIEDPDAIMRIIPIQVKGLVILGEDTKIGSVTEEFLIPPAPNSQ